MIGVARFEFAGGLEEEGSADAGNRDEARFEFTGGLENFTSEEGSADAGNRDEAGFEFTGGLEDFTSEEGTADAGNRDEAGSNAPEIEAFLSEIETFLSESSPAGAPWRSPDSAVGWDTAPVYAPSGVDIGATESELSTAATRPPLYRSRWLTMAAAALLFLAAVTAILVALAVNFFRPADGSGVYTSTPPEPATSAPAAASVDPPAAASPKPVPSGDADRTAGAAGVTAPPDERATTGARRLSSDRPVDTTAGRRENAPARDTQSLKAPPVNQRSPATGSVAGAKDAPAKPAPAPALHATGPPRDAAPIAAPPPSIATPPDRNAAAPLPIAAAPPPAANTAARTEVPSVPAPSTDTVRTPPPTSGSEAAAPEIPLAALTERGDAAAEAAAVAGINATLRRLQLAYEQRDARLAKAVWPTVNERALARAFEGLRSQSVTFDRCRMNVLSVSADVECRGVMNYVPRVGSQDQRTESRQWTFRVRKGDDQWLITNAEAR
jgi:hypothetical protein